MKRLRDSVYRTGGKKAKCVFFGVRCVRFLIENPQLKLLGSSCWTVARKMSMARRVSSALMPLGPKWGPRDVHLNQPSRLVFLLACDVLSFSWNKTNIECFVLMHEYSDVYADVISVLFLPIAHVLRKSFFLRQYDLSAWIFFYSNSVHWSQRTARGENKITALIFFFFFQ